MVDRKRKRQLYGVHLWHCVTHHEGPEGIKWKAQDFPIFLLGHWDCWESQKNKWNWKWYLGKIWAGKWYLYPPTPFRDPPSCLEMRGGKRKRAKRSQSDFRKATYSVPQSFKRKLQL